MDISRGIASIGVVFWHWIHFAYVGTAEPEIFDRTIQPLYSFFRLFYEKGGDGVAYFFLLSGFIFFFVYYDSIGRRKTSTSQFWLYRFSRLYPLHLATLLIVCLLQVVYYLKSGTTFVYANNDLCHLLLNLAFVSEWGGANGWSFNGPVWSVSVEIFLYLAFFAIAYIRKAPPLICLLISGLTYGMMLRFDFNDPICLGLSQFFLGGFVFYCADYIRNNSGRTPWIKWLAYGVTIGLWGCVLASYYSDSFELLRYFPQHPAVQRFFTRTFAYFILFPLTVGSLAITTNRFNVAVKPLVWIGDITYAVYLLHFPLQLLIGILVIFNILDRNFYLHPAALISFFTILIGLSVVTFHKFERPMQKTIRDFYKTRVSGRAKPQPITQVVPE